MINMNHHPCELLTGTEERMDDMIRTHTVN